MSIVDTANNATASDRTAAGTQTTAAAKKTLGTQYSDFLKLLTTQLNNQDPTAPADTNQITQEMAALGQVEQQINTNSLLEQLISTMGTGQISNAISYIGKQVDATGNQGVLVNHMADFVYDLPAGASSAKVTITNSTGATVFSGDGTTIAGRNQVSWNGINSTTGATMPDGAYSFSVTAKDANGKALDVTTFTTGTVRSVDTENGTSTLSLGKISIPVGSVQSVYNPGTNPGA